jgi:CelD/BcsL family acetyltransferase involved in cellulose biosynthesis
MPHVQVRRLAEGDHAAVLAVERRTYAGETQEPEHLIAARLRFEDEHYGSLNLGLFADDTLVGYVLAHLDDGSDYPGLKIADNIYVADLAVLPAHRRHLSRLLAAFGREVRLEYPGLPIVGHAIHGTDRMWQRHAAVLRRLGFVLASRRGAETAPAGSATPALVVWEPLPAERCEQNRSLATTSPRREHCRTASGKKLSTSVIVDEDGLLELRDAWQGIERAVPGLTVFQTHRYQAAWVRSFALDRKLLLVCIHDGDELIGIAPFQVSPMPMHGKVHQQLSFLGAPWEVDRPQFLFRRDARDCAEAAAQALLARRDQWDVIWFHEQDATDAVLATFCAALSRHGVLHGRVPSSNCPYLTFEGTWEQLLATKSQKFRKNLKAARKKLQAAGRLEYTNCTGDERQLQQLFGEYELLEGRGWKARKGVGVSQSVAHLRFYRHLIHAFGDSGHFVFRCLRLDGQLVAATFGLLHERRFYSLHIAYDAAFAACSPGTYLESLEIEECFRSGLDEYDFLGGFLTNKVRWATRARDTVEVHLYQRQPRLIAAYLYFFQFKPRLKQLLARCGIRWPSKPRTDRIDEAA